MKNLFYKFAKKYVEEYDKDKKQKMDVKNAAEKARRDLFDSLIAKFKRIYLDDIIKNFKETTQPAFSVGEIVITNWYDSGSRWDGTMQGLQSHTPYKGPIEVEIKAVSIDFLEIADIIDSLKANDNFYGCSDGDYSFFKGVVDAHRNKYDISWAYKIQVVNDDHEYWKYDIRENHFIKKNSFLVEISTTCYQDELKCEKLEKELKDLRENIRHLRNINLRNLI